MKVNITYKILLLVSTALVLGSCAKMESPDEPNYDYGEIYVDVELSGEVVYAVKSINEEGETVEEFVPVENIGVSLLNSGYETYTNSGGRFIFVREDVPIGRKPNLRLKIMFNDIDGYANGGMFNSKTINEPVEVLIENKPLQADIKVVLEKATDTNGI